MTRALAPVFVVSDRALPGRDVLLDAEETRSVLSRTLGEGRVRIDGVTRVRAKYRPGESLRVLYRVEVQGETHLVSGRMRAAGADRLFEEAREAATPCGSLRGVALDRDLQCVFWTFPNDRRLRQPTIPFERHPLMDELWGGSVALTVAGYAPERAVVYRVEREGSRGALAYLKQFAPGGARPARDVLVGLASANHRAARPVRVPRVLGPDEADEADEADDLLVTEAIGGTHLHALSDSSLDGAFLGLGSALGRLHALPLASPLVLEDPFSASALRAGAHILAPTRPDLAEDVAMLTSRLIASRPAVGDRVWIHGDLNSRNWLTVGDEVGLFDFDQSMAGPPGVDVGSVLAWMRVRTLLGLWSPFREAALVERFMAGYARHQPPFERHDMWWYRAAALLLQRAVRAVTRVRERQLALLPHVVAAAAADLEAMEAGVHAR